MRVAHVSALLVGSTLFVAPFVGLEGVSAAKKPKKPIAKIELMRKHQAELNTIAVRHVFTFDAPTGFTVVAASAKDGPVFTASLESAHADMHAWIDNSATPVSDLALTEAALARIEKWTADHPLGSCRLVKKAVGKHELGPYMRLVFDLREGGKLEKATRELLYVITTATHTARIVYTAPTASFARVEKLFDASMQKTRSGDAPATTTTTTTSTTTRSGLEPKLSPAP